MKKTEIPINSFYYYANEYRKHLTDEDQIEKTNMTEPFLQELELHIKEGEILKLNINGKMRLGKSTLAIAIAHNHVYELLKKHNQKKGRFGIKNICRDQQEYTTRMRDPNLMHDVLVIDENNELENTGENVTAEQALRRNYSDVQAGRYVHDIYISPKDAIDPNSDVMLSVISVNKKEKTTRAKLYYRFFEGGNEYCQLLGYVEIYVGNIIDTWDKEAKKLFFKRHKTTIDQKRLETLQKKDFYTEYMIKKYEKMDLINKEGIFKPRVLDYADVIIKVIQRLQPLCKIRGLVNSNLVRNYIKLEFTNAKIPTSIIGEDLATREALGVLDMFKSQYQLKQEIDKKRNKGQETKQQEKLIETITEGINLQMTQYSKYADINKKYHTIESEQ